MTTKIISTGCYVPGTIITNDDLSQRLDTSDAWIYPRTGIRRRHAACEEDVTELAVRAAQDALEKSGVDPGELGVILVATSTARDIFPSTACRVQEAIGAREAVCFDLNAACTGFLFALQAAHGMMTAGGMEKGLVIGADVMTRIVDWEDRSTCVLFGDGAGAAVLSRSDRGIVKFESGSDGTGGSVLTFANRRMGRGETGPDYLRMDGQEVFRFACRTVPACIRKLLEETGTEKEEVDYYILHQANRRIIEQAARRLELPMERFPVNMEEYGNTSAASIPVMLAEMEQKGLRKAGGKIVLAGFGAGLTWSAALMEW